MFSEFISALGKILSDSGAAQLFADRGYLNLIMIGVSFVLLYLGIKKGFEPLLMIPIAFGMLLANLPLANLGVQYSDIPGFVEVLMAGKAGLIDILYFGVKAGIYPPLIFMGIGAWL